MKTKLLIIILSVFLLIGATGVYSFMNTKIIDNTDYSVNNADNPNYKVVVDESFIQRDKSNMKGLFKFYYDKYIAYTAPNKKNIFIVATKEITDTQLLYAYSVLQNYLEADNGYDMDALANRIADSGQYLVMANGTDGNSSTPMFAIKGQPLYYTEVAAPGSDWFMKNDYEHRDATFEEILHFTHDYGIGTTQNPGQFPEYSKKIKEATFNALPENKADWGTKGLWAYSKDGNTKSWLTELEQEGSLEQEYLASVIDSYYGLWSAFNEPGGMWGMYIAKDRTEIRENDPMGHDLLHYFNPYIVSFITFDSSLQGNISLSLDENNPYTYKTQYYKNVRFTGDNNLTITGNDQDNTFVLNNGSSTVDGKDGFNVVQYDQSSDAYSITFGETILVKNNETGKTDTLTNINVLRFTDKDINTKGE